MFEAEDLTLSTEKRLQNLLILPITVPSSTDLKEKYELLFLNYYTYNSLRVIYTHSFTFLVRTEFEKS